MTIDAGSQPLRVVVIDDEAHVRTLVRLTLHRSSRAVVVGESDGSADDLAELCAQGPDVVLLDQNLDGVRGTDLIGEITRVAPNAMIAMLTALDPASVEAAALSAGAFVFYEKAVVADHLVDHLVDDYQLFCQALAGREVIAPSAAARRRASTTSSPTDADADADVGTDADKQLR